MKKENKLTASLLREDELLRVNGGTGETGEEEDLLAGLEALDASELPGGRLKAENAGQGGAGDTLLANAAKAGPAKKGVSPAGGRAARGVKA